MQIHSSPLNPGLPLAAAAARPAFSFEAIPGQPSAAVSAAGRWSALRSLAASALASVVALAAVMASAQTTQTWNTGSGTWDTTTANWAGGTTWTNGNAAIFGGLTQWESVIGTPANQAITLGSNITTTGVTFNYTGTSVGPTASETLTLTGGATISVQQLPQGPATTWSNGNSYVNTVSAIIAGSNGLTKSGVGALSLSAANTYSGTTTVSNGILRLANATAVPGGINATGGTSGLTLSGGVVELANGNLLRNLGTGADQFQITGGVSGFSSQGGTRTVTINNSAATTVQWGSSSFNPSTLVLNAFTADNTLTFSNPIDLNGASRTIRSDSVGTSAKATIAAAISDSAAAGAGVTKTGAGFVEFGPSAANTYAGPTVVNGGILRLSNANSLPGGIGATGGTSALTLNGGVIELNAGNFSRPTGTGVTDFRITGGISGFSANTSIRAVNAGGAGATLTWGSANFNPSVLLLNDVTAGAQLDVTNPINLNGATRTIAVNSAGSVANLNGALSDSVGGGGLQKIGPGILQISAVSTYQGRTDIKGGTLNLGASDVLPDNAPLTLAANDGANSSLADGVFASQRSTITGGNGASPGVGFARFDMKGFNDTVGTVTVEGNNSFLIGNRGAGTGGVLTTTGSFEVRGGQILAVLAGTNKPLNKTGGGLALLDPQNSSNGANTALSNTYTGTTTISGGVLRIFNNDAIPGGIAPTGGLSALTINGGVLELGNDNVNAVANFGRGLGTGAAQVQITGGRSGFSTWNKSSIVDFGGSGALVTWGTTFFNPSTLVLNETTAGRGSSLTLTFNNLLDLNTTTSARTIDVSAVHSATYAGIMQGTIMDSGAGAGLTKTGQGVLQLNAGNTYAGPTTIKSGAVIASHNAALGASGAGNQTIVESGAALRIQGTLTVPESITLNGTGYVNNSFLMLSDTTGNARAWYNQQTLGNTGGNTGALRNISDANTISGAVTLASASRIQADAGTLTLSGGIAGTDTDLTVGGSGNVSITTIGTGLGKLTVHGATAGSTQGTLTLTGASTYTGTTTIRGGTLALPSANATLPSGMNVAFTGAGTFVATDPQALDQMGSLTLTNGDATVSSVYSSGGGLPTMIGFSSMTRAAGSTVSFTNKGGTRAFTYGGNGNVIAVGGQSGFMGPWAFYGSTDGTSTPTGNGYAWYDATSGFVRDYRSTDADFVAVAGSTTGMGGITASSNAVLSGSITGQTTATVNTVNLGANNLTMDASNTLSTGGLLSSGSSTATFTAGNLQANVAGGELVVRVDKSTDILTVSSVIQDNTSASSLTKSGAGKLTISTAPTYTGKTTVAGGNLTFSALTAGTLPSKEIVVNNADLTLPSSAYYVGNSSLTGGTSNNKITIQNAGRLTETQQLYIGFGVNADYNTITVDGIGSQLNNTGGFFSLGFSGDHNKIVVSNGGYYGASGGNAGSRYYIGENMGADYNTIEVSGAGSLLETSGNPWLTIGGMGSNNGVTLTQGGMMWSGFVTLGGVAVGVAGGSNNTVSVADAGSIFATRKGVSIGRGVNSANNGITVSNGGMVYTQGQNNIAESARAFELGASTGADNNYIVVTGSGSRFFADAGWDSNGNTGANTNTNVGLQNGVIGYATTAAGNHVDILDGAIFAMTVRLDIGGINSKLNLGNGSGAKSLGMFRGDVALNTDSARVVLNNGEFKFTSATGTISGLGKVQLDGVGYVTSEWASAANVIASEITGVGSLIKDGPGLLSLTGANTYTGDTSVIGGTLSLTNPVLNDMASVSLALSTFLNLNFSGTDTVGQFLIDGVPQATGTWGAVGSTGTTYTSSYLTGTGVLNVTAVPEPETFVLLGVGLAAVGFLRRRRAA